MIRHYFFDKQCTPIKVKTTLTVSGGNEHVLKRIVSMPIWHTHLVRVVLGLVLEKLGSVGRQIVETIVVLENREYVCARVPNIGSCK